MSDEEKQSSERIATLGKLAGKKLRSSQIDAIDFIKEVAGTKFIAVRGPTGVGKTCLGFESMKPPFYYVCNSIQLQEQALRDYPEARLLKGRSHYKCKKFGTADLCVQRKPCPDCEYQREKAIALGAPMAVINFHYFLYTANFTKFPERNVIIDEADALETVLIDFISFDFSYQRLISLGIVIDMPHRKTKIDVMPKWLKELSIKVIHEMNAMENDVRIISKKHGTLEEWEIRFLKKYKGLDGLRWKLGVLKDQDLIEDWIYRYDDKRRTITLKPVWLTRELADEFLFKRGGSFLLMSATIPSKSLFCGVYQVEAEELAYKDLPNVWDTSKRKIYLMPSYKLSKSNWNKETLDKMREVISEILEIEKGRGVIHSVSFELSKEITPVSDRLIVHNGKNKDEMFQKFLNTKGAVFVSPSSTRGIDLPDDLCEFIIWPKAPFLSLGDPQVAARAYGGGKIGRMWYASDAIQTIVQGCGRGFRHPKDYCNIYLLDELIEGLVDDYPDLFPGYFRGEISCRSLETLKEILFSEGAAW